VGLERIFIVNGAYTSDVGELDDIVESINKLALMKEDKDKGTYWNTGATKGVFHDRAVFKEYRPLARPIQVNGFGSNLATVAIAIGSVVLHSFVNGREDRFTLTKVLHIPDAQCNLVSGIQLEYKGAFAVTGNGKVYLYTRDLQAICRGRDPKWPISSERPTNHPA
jgi:hypothetical protein